MDPEKRMADLAQELLRHQHLYYVKTKPEISDSAYDRLFDELVELEKKFPQFSQANSPTQRVGSDLDNAFPERPHTLPVLSLDKAYTVDEATAWMKKIRGAAGEEVAFTVEDKIDGASIALYYDRGELQSALTRGNGYMGNDVVENIRTIRQVPLQVDEPAALAVRGEIYLDRFDFDRLNVGMELPYANPRNLAAGTLRNLHSSLVARVPLQVFVYEGFFSSAPDLDYMEVLQRLEKLGFRLNPKFGFFCDDKRKRAFWADRFPLAKIGPLEDFPAFAKARTMERKTLSHKIDGLVVKVNEMGIRQRLGYTAHHPRWAMALKFDAPQAVTRLLAVTIQIGRNGRVTPVAELEPIKLSGSLISRATLHNQDYIDLLELGIDDDVTISKRGDVIPAIERVIEKSSDHPSIYKIPPRCPFCNTAFIKSGAHLFCNNDHCPERRKRLLVHFASKDQMNIETLGEKTVALLYDRGWVSQIPDFYSFDYRQLLQEEGFKEKKISRIRQNLESSKQKPFASVLTAMGLEGLGSKAAEALIANGFETIERILATAARGEAETFARIEGIGPVTAKLLVRHFIDPRNLELIERLKAAGLRFSETPKPRPGIGPFSGQTWVITGSFERFQPRDLAAKDIERRGGKVLSTVTAKTTHLLAGSKPGSKLEKARQLGVTILTEPEFLDYLKSNH